ncbi:MAG TPA: ribose 5-phosphate isomerase B [Spirochaetota bacterium]|nr:ribose 5-phosphate isomerase B [Spirochaetota bacterium]
MKIAIGSDHAGLRLRKILVRAIQGVEFIDVGTDSEESCDYPDYISQVAQHVKSGKADAGIALCGTGIGASIVANKFDGIRAALCTNCFMAEMSKRHNNANVLVIGARVVGDDLAVRIVESWLGAEYEGGRHQRRLDKIAAIERNG